MKQYSIMIKPASSLCNMRCSYCFYSDISEKRAIPSYGIMEKETTEKMVEHLFVTLKKGDRISIAFQGGEPTLAGLSYFEHFIDTVKRFNKGVEVAYALQTNGLLLDEKWCAFLKENHFLVGLSVDGYRELHNAYRLDGKGKGTFDQVMAGKKHLDKAKVDYNILATLTNQLARHPQRVFRFLKEEKVRYVQFTPCLGELKKEKTENPEEEWALTPKRFHSFYRDLYTLWKKEVFQGNYISIKLFDDIVNLFIRGEVTSCGLHGVCQIHYVVEGNGQVYPCDFYVIDEFFGGDFQEENIEEIERKLADTGFLSADKREEKLCKTCKYQPVCKGGCKRMASSMYVDAKGNFCGYRALLDDIGEDLCMVGTKMLKGEMPMPQ